MRRAALVLPGVLFAGITPPRAQTLKGWTKGKGFGWVWGSQDETGALNAILTPVRILQAMRRVENGKVYDLSVPLDQFSYKFAGHSPTSIVSYRSPEGVKRGGRHLLGGLLGWVLWAFAGRAKAGFGEAR
jgi:hypothetical protein